MKILTPTLILLLATTALADGVNKKRKVVHKMKHVAEKPAPKTPARTPKQPSLLETANQLTTSLTPKPLAPMLDIPIVPQQPLTTITVERYEFDTERRCKYCFFLLGGLAVIPFLLPDDEAQPPATPPRPPGVINPTTIQPVPEPATLILFVTSISGWWLLRRQRHR